MSSKILDKYEYFTGEDLALKPSTVEQVKFEYSPLSKIFIKGLDKDEDKEEGLFKILKNIEGKIKAKIKINQNQLKMKNNQKQVKINQPSLITNLNKLYL